MKTGQFVGTPDDVAPEQIEREPVGPPADEYALTCVLYECLAGQAPFRSESLMGTLWAHVHDAPPPVSEVLDPVFATGMAKDPTDRYPTCRELIQACRGALGVSGEFPPPGGSAQVPLLRRREFLVGAGSPRSPSQELSPPYSSHEAAARTPAPRLRRRTRSPGSTPRRTRSPTSSPTSRSPTLWRPERAPSGY